MSITPLPSGLFQSPQLVTSQYSSDASRSNPAQGDRIQRLNAKGLTPLLCQKLLQIRRDLKESWATQRMIKVRETLKAIEYSKDNQFLVLDPYTNTYFNPFNSGGAGGGTANAANLANLYQYAHNYIQFLEGVYVSILKASVPRVEWWPDNAEDDRDNRAAQTRSRASRMIGRQNNESMLLEQQLKAFFYSGSYFRRTKWTMDERLCTPVYEDIIEFRPQQIVPHRYACPNCGTQNPTDITGDMSEPPGATCQGCGMQLGSQHFFPGVTANMPVVTGQKKVVKGRVTQSIFNVLQVDAMPYAPADTANPLLNTPMIDLVTEIFSGALRGMYPDSWDLVKQNTDSSSPNAESDRIARLRSLSPSVQRGITTPSTLPTYHRTHFQPDAYDFLDEKEHADALHKSFPEGICLATLGETVLDGYNCAMQNEWSWAGVRTDVGLYPPARVAPAMPLQDEINDNENTLQEYCERLSGGVILANEKVVGKELNNQYLPPGRIITVPGSSLGPDFDLQKAFFQFKAELNGEVFKRSAELKMTIQLLTRIVPQTYGGTQKGIDTATGQEQALRVAMGVLWGDWDQIRQETSNAANLSVDCFAKNALDDVYDVIQDKDSPDFKNEPIRLADMAGKAHAHPEADQAYPMSFEQQKLEYTEMIKLFLERGKENPLIAKIFDNYQNRRQMIRYVAPPDTQLPEENARRWVQQDLVQIIEQQPLMTLNPLTGAPQQEPSVEPNPDILRDYWDEAIECAVTYALVNGRELMAKAPDGFQNLMSYIEKLRFLQSMAQTPAMNPGAPGGGADAGAPGGVPGSPIPGLVAPTPAPPMPGATAAPMAIQ